MKTPLLAVMVSLALLGCGGGGGSAAPNNTATTPLTLKLPTGFPQPRTADNPLTVEKVALGRHLFYDRRMSINEAGSCASCHEQRKAFSDGRQTSTGPTGGVHPRNAMSLTNVVYNARQNWANPTLSTLREQALAVMFADDPVELGWADNEAQILARFARDPLYQELFAKAYPDQEDPYTVNNVASATAAFVATLISGASALDQANNGSGSVSESVRRGEALFFSERLECFHCHGAFNFAQSVQHDGTILETIEFKNNGLYNIAGPGPGLPLSNGNYPAGNQGLYEFTQDASDMGRFRAPTLRNIELTGPYMHDGSIATLEDVITEHYARAGRRIETGPEQGDGAQSPWKDPLLQGFVLSEQELDDLLNFFSALTDWDFVCNPEFADPFGNIPMHDQCP
nr:di-heme enzyme [Oceanococcus sp. HetDA_MAG_MS8]